MIVVGESTKLLRDKPGTAHPQSCLLHDELAGHHHRPAGRLLRMNAAIASTESGRFPRWANCSALNPCWFFSCGSAPSCNKSFTAAGVPYMAAIISGVVPLGDSAS